MARLAASSVRVAAFNVLLIAGPNGNNGVDFSSEEIVEILFNIMGDLSTMDAPHPQEERSNTHWGASIQQ